jgi:hypothetical protein
MPRFTLSLALSVLALAGCDRSEAPPPGNDPQSAPSALPIELPKSLPLPEPAVGRAELLAAVARAASAYASGADDRQAQEELAGRQFTLRIRFGCGGPTAPDAEPVAWTYDEAEGRLRLRATPNIILDRPEADAPEGKQVEAVEGFWIPRPWLLDAACPAGAGFASMPDGNEVGIVQYFTADDSRVEHRSGRSYESLKRVSAAEAPKAGIDFVLTGRLEPSPDGKVISCRSVGAARPQCIVSAKFGRIAFEDVAQGLTLAEWGAG